MLAGHHFRPMLEPAPVFGDEELLRLTMSLRFLAGKKDALLPAAASVRRRERLLPYAATHLFQDCGHAVIGRTNEIPQFQLRSGPA